MDGSYTNDGRQGVPQAASSWGSLPSAQQLPPQGGVQQQQQFMPAPPVPGGGGTTSYESLPSMSALTAQTDPRTTGPSPYYPMPPPQSGYYGGAGDPDVTQMPLRGGIAAVPDSMPNLLPIADGQSELRPGVGIVPSSGVWSNTGPGGEPGGEPQGSSRRFKVDPWASTQFAQPQGGTSDGDAMGLGETMMPRPTPPVSQQELGMLPMPSTSTFQPIGAPLMATQAPPQNNPSTDSFRVPPPNTESFRVPPPNAGSFRAPNTVGHAGSFNVPNNNDGMAYSFGAEEDKIAER